MSVVKVAGRKRRAHGTGLLFSHPFLVEREMTEVMASRELHTWMEEFVQHSAHSIEGVTVLDIGSSTFQSHFTLYIIQLESLQISSSFMITLQ